MTKYGKRLLSGILSAAMLFGSATTTMVATAVPAFAEEIESEEVAVVSRTHAISVSSIMRDTGKPSGMYTFEGAIVTEQEDGSYLVRMHQASVNRNVLALTDDKDAAKAHAVDWHVGAGADGYWFTIPVASLDQPVYAVMSSDSRIAAGNDFSNVIVISFDATSMTDTEEADVTAADMNVSPAVPAEVSKTHAIEVTSIMRDTGKPSGMYTFEGAIVTEQEDGSYLVRMHQASVNRNVLALTDDKDAAKAHTVDWHVGAGADGYWFTIPVASLDETLYAVMSSESRIAAGNDFSNVIAITFNTESMTDTEEADAVAEDMNVSPAVPAVSKTHAIEVTSIMRDTGKPSGMYTFEGAIVTEQEDGSYFVRMHQASVNRNVLALTDDKDAAKAHTVDWHVGAGADGYWFTIPVASLDETLYAVMSSESRIAAGNDFSNVIAITFNAESMTDTEEADAVAEDVNVSPAVPAEPVIVPTAIVTQPENFTGNVGDIASFCVEAEGTDLVYQWYYSKDGKKWYKSGIAGSDTAAITFKVSSTNKTNSYRCVVTGADEETITSDVAAISVPEAAVITKNPETVIAEKGQMVTFTVEAEHAVSYQWYYTKDGSKWYKSSATGADTAEFSIKVSSSNIENVYRCKVTGEDGSTVVSESAGIYVPQPAVITAQPVDAGTAIGEAATFTVEAEHAVTYQWYYSKNGGENWYKSSCTGSTTNTMTVKMSSSNCGNKYRCKITGENGKVIYTDTVGF